MKQVRTILIGLFALAASACSLPGLKYQDGGSDIWKGQPGEAGYNPDTNLQIAEITPTLVASQAQQAQARDASHTTPSLEATRQQPWVYRVGGGDILSVIVWDHPELTNPAGTTQSVESSGRVVRPDGSMFYPYAGNLQVAGKTPEEIRQMLVQGLSKVIQSPQVDVRVLQFRSQFVNVVGDVDQPCRLPITDTAMTMIDAMNSCKTIRASASHRDVTLVRAGDRRAVDLYDVYRGTDPFLNQPLVGGDTLYVEDDRRNRIFVVGEVNNQIALTVPVSGLTLADALNEKEVGGLNQVTVNSSNIYVFRGGISESDLRSGHIDRANFQPQIFHLNAKSADALLVADRFRLEPRDVVYASSASLVNYSRAASLVIPSISTLLQTYILFR